MNKRRLQNIIKESVKHVLQEGHWDNDVYEQWREIEGTIGAEAMLDEAFEWMDGDSIEEFLENIKRMYDLD